MDASINTAHMINTLAVIEHLAKCWEVLSLRNSGERMQVNMWSQA